MTADNRNTGDASASEPLANATPASDFSSWVQEARSRPSPSEAEGPAPRLSRLRRHYPRIVLSLLAALSVGWFLYLLGVGKHTVPTGIQARIYDPKHRPLAGARVFLTSDPTVATVTDRDGEFCLSVVPSGRQSVVVALEDAGQEYPVIVKDASLTNMGELVYSVPPQHIRRAPGGGAGWTGKRAND
jgi:hypothetical protein